MNTTLFLSPPAGRLLPFRLIAAYRSYFRQQNSPFEYLKTTQSLTATREVFSLSPLILLLLLLGVSFLLQFNFEKDRQVRCDSC